MRIRLPAAVIAIGILAVTASGCSFTESGTATAAPRTLADLDTGRFSTAAPKPASPSDTSKPEMAELARLATNVMSPYLVDSQYSTGASAAALSSADMLANYLDQSAVAIAHGDGFVEGFSTGSADGVLPLQKASRGTTGHEGLAITVMCFPSAAKAADAASQIGAADFAVSPDNVAVKLPKYSSSEAHWRPTVPTLGSLTVSGQCVIDVLADTHTADLTHLTDITERYLDAEVPLLANYVPPAGLENSTVEMDPDRVLARVLHMDGRILLSSDTSDVVYTLPAYTNFVLDQASRYPVMQRAGIDRIAMTHTVFVFRTRDDAAARQFLIDSAGLGDAGNHVPVDPPAGVPGATCIRDLTVRSAGEFRCFVSYGRYAALVLGDKLWETQQRAAAQYVLLAQSGP